ncbi:hypothetical protein FA95DRAFT_1602122 [Auriscalpium vulgare]|uniref:Uncharacterized protein n=1 Tax=Auriscalpium vulgare TaxID=40419 RepID=A0ACB8S7Q9_9AGAM|nr:hypothetical protein FA95DRAFT_1602122 [Auriscalpium vulgare]
MLPTPSRDTSLATRPTSEVLLTVETRHHIRILLDTALEEETAFDGRGGEWAGHIETALYDLAKAMQDGGWLAGVRLARIAHAERRRLEEAARQKQEQEQAAKEAKEGDGRAKGKPRTSQVAETARVGTLSEVKLPFPSAEPDVEERSVLALQQLRVLAAQRGSTSTASKHLLLTAVLPDQLPSADNSAPRCQFTPGVFSLPAPDLFGEDPTGNGAAAAESALYGFKEWDTRFPESSELVGGTFSFTGKLSSDAHTSLRRVLRVAVYALLSQVLEQHVLSNLGVALRYPAPTLPPPAPPAAQAIHAPHIAPLPHRNSSPDVKHRHRDAFNPSALWSMFSRKTGSLLHRAVTVNPYGTRGGSLDLARPVPESLPLPTPRTSVEGGLIRRLSIFGEQRPPAPPPPQPVEPELPFQAALRRIESQKALLSTSAGVILSPPSLLSRLAEREKENPSRRLTGEERTGLSSILGWEGKKAAGRGMAGTSGFVRQQSLSVLYSEHVPDHCAPTEHAPLEGEAKLFFHCGLRAQLLTYIFYSVNGDSDRNLGEVVSSMCAGAGEPCSRPECKTVRGKHEQQWMHNSLRIVAVVIEDEHPSLEDLEVWQSCRVCAATTPRCKVNDGAYLYSFAKFLELLLYSPAICSPSLSLCPHTTPPPQPWTGADAPLPQSRFNIRRHFSYKSHSVSFSLSAIPDVFELRVPRLQIMHGWSEKPGSEKIRSSILSVAMVAQAEAERRELRREIKTWWQSIAEHLDKLELQFVDADDLSVYHKALPRLPSADDQWESSSESPTPRNLTVSLPPTLANTPTHEGELSFSSIATFKPPSRSFSDPHAPHTDKDSHDTVSFDESISLLSNMRFNFQRTEQTLYAQLSEVPDATINDVRRSFHSAAQGATKRLTAWETKHVAKEARRSLTADREAIPEPRWWGHGYHAVPGGSVIVQEEDWGSIIAFTLSSLDYQRELANMAHPRSAAANSAFPVPPAPQPPPPTSSIMVRAAASTSTSSFKFFAPSPRLDPDRDDTVWHEPETHSAVISRKEHPRDPTSLLSLREVLRKVPADGSHGLPSSVFTSVSRMVSGGAPPSAWAKPAVEVSRQAADGQVTLPDTAEAVGKILHEMDAVSLTSSKGTISSTGTGVVETNIHRGKTSSVISRSSTDSNGTVGPDNSAPSSTPPHPDTLVQSPALEQPDENSAFSWTSSLTNAMRYMLKTEQSSHPGSPVPKNHHGLLSADPLTIDARPHIKYDWTIGKRLKFSCTVYYAKQFDALRRRCGIEDVFLKSMAKCENWAAQGGKSRSNFWKTSDDRFIVKTLVNAWNVADLQVLIDLAPSYFAHMESTASRASVLAKLLGFYTVEVRNLETGNVQAKADLLVMENLFYGQKPAKTFDLKGIQGRKVKPNSNSSASNTLFDGEWIEGQQRALTLVHPHSKAVLREGLRSDCDWLSRSNIMDYSLLLGIDEEHKEIRCGLVDTIGSYTFAKTLEYKAKGLSGRDGKDITVIPPHEYEERFVSALDSYFLACPDKWTKPPEDKKIQSDPAALPSVL